MVCQFGRSGQQCDYISSGRVDGDTDLTMVDKKQQHFSIPVENAGDIRDCDISIDGLIIVVQVGLAASVIDNDVPSVRVPEKPIEIKYARIE